MNKHSSIINFWRAIELFEPKDISRNETSNDSNMLIDIDSENNFPIPPEYRKDNEFFQFYCGVIKIEKIVEKIALHFDYEKLEDYAGSRSGKTAVFTFTANSLGEFQTGTFTLASSAWVLGKTISSDHRSIDWLDGFEKKSSEISEYFDQRISLLQKGSDDSISESDEKSKPGRLSYSILIDITENICRKLGLNNLIEPANISYKTFSLKSATDGKNVSESFGENSTILNSFFQRDLKLVAQEIDSGNYGDGLKKYLLDDQDLNYENRVDLKHSTEALFNNLSPELFPSGRWADKGLFKLAFSQQFAVNTIFELLEGKKGGLFSVNGPPGTGKTTMLKDIIAAVIINRAKVLTQFTDPDKAFAGKNKMWEGKDGRKNYISPVDERLKKSGIVIASSNNEAVRNVTNEFPVKEKFDKEWWENCEYFSATATDLVGQPAWGLIAATLGNSKNRSEFNTKFWFRENGLLEILKQTENQSNEPDEKGWENSVREFNDALAFEEEIRQSKIEIWKKISEKTHLEKRFLMLSESQNQTTEKLNVIQSLLKSAQIKKTRLESEQESLSQQKKIHDGNRPSIFSIITSWGKPFKEWKTGNVKIQKRLSELVGKVLSEETEISKIKAAYQEVEAEMCRLREEINQNRKSYSEIQNNLHIEYQNDISRSIPKIDEWRDAERRDERELSAPWFDEKWNSARVNVFAKAMQLHKAFILVNAKAIKRNLGYFVDLLSGKLRGDHQTEGASDVWATIFLVVPVISTTFASFANQFKTLGREEIGWLLIDEAGQAVPQAAAGAIWRSQRTVVVGDPLQLEPVSTIPPEMEKTLAQNFGVSDVWLPGQTSVQELSDRANPIGTYISNGNKEIWVGSPLAVHRRCSNPMFKISNTIAYGEMMVYGTPERQSNYILPESCWVNVESAESTDHWIPAEGEEVKSLIEQLIKTGCSPEKIYIISPFSQVSKKLNYLGKKGIKTIGTVHKTQGKENDVVIIVLGGNPQKPGAKTWASSKPNLLNVAVSRAKERVYVIGNKAEWGKLPYFNTLRKCLDDVSTH